jgi:hypothetical protein
MSGQVYDLFTGQPIGGEGSGNPDDWTEGFIESFSPQYEEFITTVQALVKAPDERTFRAFLAEIREQVSRFPR